MQEEIFGPILPILTYSHIDEAIAFINQREKPLAFYIFSHDKAIQKKLLKHCSFGGGCINDTIIHLATSELGFGGVGIVVWVLIMVKRVLKLSHIQEVL